MATLYNANRDTFEYIEGDTEAHANPMYSPETHDVSDQYLYNPETSSLLPPGPTKENETNKLINGVWVVSVDHRGSEYWTQDGQKHSIDDLGIEIPEGSLAMPPPSEFHLIHDGFMWILDTEEKYNAETRSAISFRVAAYTEKGGTDAAMIEWLRLKFSDDPEVSEINARVNDIKFKFPKPL